MRLDCRSDEQVVTQSREACEVAVEGDPLAAPFDGKRSKPGIGDAPASCVGVPAKPSEYLPMPFARRDQVAMRQIQEVVAEPKCVFERTGRLKLTQTGRDPNDSTQGERRQSEPRLARY